jgi:thiamine biosynthesis lipoprotein
MPATVSLALHAMATRFELVLHGENQMALRAAGEEALREIERLESQLSLYRSSSEIAHLNAHAASGPVRVSPGVFALLRQAKELHQESGGAFDITIAPLVKCWGFMHGTGRLPGAQELAEGRARVGMHLVELNAEDFTVRFLREGVMLDLGAIGKGYAIECAAEILREAGITGALLHGGTSTIQAIGHPAEADAWFVALPNPGSPATRAKANSDVLATVPLKDEAMSVSAVWGKSFEAEGKKFGHVLDPRTGEPARASLMAAVVLRSATETDALSTALLIAGASGHARLAKLRPGMRTLLVTGSPDKYQVEASGISMPASPSCNGVGRN